jgi:hypothetical protein
VREAGPPGASFQLAAAHLSAAPIKDRPGGPSFFILLARHQASGFCPLASRGVILTVSRGETDPVLLLFSEPF